MTTEVYKCNGIIEEGTTVLLTVSGSEKMTSQRKGHLIMF